MCFILQKFIPSSFLWDGYPFKCSLVIYTFPFWNAFHLFWGTWQSLLPAVELCWWVISHPCAFISVTKCTSISSTRKFLKHLVIALKEIWDCNYSFNKNTGFINIKYILHCSVFMPFCKHNDFFVCQITVKSFWRYFQ